MEQHALGEICTIIKGLTGIKKATPGEYPLVVTAEERLSCNEYQLDAKAVCIPLVSSTGHGHASLKRIHYQEGKFALGNILAAVMPNNEKQLSAEYLYYYLTFYKDSKIVPLMRGAANVSLTINSIKTIVIDFPDIDTQYKIIETIKNANKRHNTINKKYAEQDLLIKNLKESILLDAAKGKLVPQNPTDEPASELLKRIKTEKEQPIKDGKIKKEKLFPPITEDEIPFDIPTSWTWCRVNDIGIYKKGPFGSALTKKIFVPKSSNAIKVYEQKNAIKKDATLGEYYISKEYYEKSMKNFTVSAGDVIVSCAGTIGETYVMPKNIELGIINQALMRMTITKEINLKYFLTYFEIIIKKDSNTHSKGSAIKNIPPFEIFKSMLVPLPPLAEQQRIVAKVNELMQLFDQLEGENINAQKSSSELLQSIMQKYFTPKA